MTSEYLRQLLAFHYWARDRVMVAVESLSAEQYARPMGNSFSSIRDTLNHIYFAEWIWHSRLNGVSPPSMPSDDIPDLATLREHWAGLERKVRAYADDAGEAGLRRVIDYRLMNGTDASSQLFQIMAHVVNHATYHRGQVTTMLRQLGAAPAKSTDMITYFRETTAVSGIKGQTPN